jgi:hypothetical protein
VDSTHLPALVLVLVLVPVLVLVLVLVLELELELELVEPVLVLALAMVEPVLYPSHLSRNWSRWLTEMCPAAPSISCGASTKVRELALGPWTTQLLPSSSKRAMMQVAVPPLQTAARTLPSQSGLPLQAPFCLVSSVIGVWSVLKQVAPSSAHLDAPHALLNNTFFCISHYLRSEGEVPLRASMSAYGELE